MHNAVTLKPDATFRFGSAHGQQIACARWNSRGPAHGIVQIAHGMGEHIGRYLDTIDVLRSAGLTVYGNDHRGHGHTARTASDFGAFGDAGFSELVHDMVRLTRVARHENSGLPLILIGHGMGSFAAQQYVLEHSFEIDGLILSGSGALDRLAHLASSEAAAATIFNDPFEPARTPFDWLSRDKSVVDAFITDPLCFATLQPAAFASLLGAAPRLRHQSSLRQIRKDLPIYIFSGDEDSVGQQLSAVKLLIDRYRQAGLRNICADFYPGGRHEMLNEINRHEVHARLLTWISFILDNRRACAA